jgi:hypothetical protein
MATFYLTTGKDSIVTPASGSTVYATADTLNPGDLLTGGTGIDVLELEGSGYFNVNQLAYFAGFESIKVDNTTSSYAYLTLGSQPIEVDSTGNLAINVNSPSNWNGSDVINGDPSPSSVTAIVFNNQNSPSSSLNYDLTSNTFSHVTIDGSGYLNGGTVSLKINNTNAAAIQAFTGDGLHDKLVTAESTLDLSHTTVDGFRVTSTNTGGTTFTVADLSTAFQIGGGPGHDTLVAQGFTLTADQRAAIFATSSVETIVDQTATYSKPSGTTTLTTGNDTIVTPSSGATVYATAATLNPGDRLTGGAGIDVLELVGSGTFRVDQLASFTGFQSIKVDNYSSNHAYLTLGSQPIEVDSTGLVEIVVNSPSNWNGSNIINGDSSASSTTFVEFSNASSPSTSVNYDLTSNTFSHATIIGSGYPDGAA